MKLTFFLCLFVLICFFSCASKKEVITDKGTTNEEVNKKEIEENTTQQTEDYTLTFGEGETFSTDFEVVIFGDSGRYNLQTGEATGVKNVIKNKEEQKKQNTTNYNKTQQNTTKNTEVNTTDSLIFNKKNITQEVEVKQNNWYIWVIVGGVLTIVIIVGIRILLKSILL